MIRLYFGKYYPTDLAEAMESGVGLKHPRLVYANTELKKVYNAKIGRELGWNGRYYFQFHETEDLMAFKLKYGFF